MSPLYQQSRSESKGRLAVGRVGARSRPERRSVQPLIVIATVAVLAGLFISGCIMVMETQLLGETHATIDLED
jgi:hypothetical protein